MDSRARAWLRVETVVASTAGGLGVLTTLWRDWIELIFRVDPDDHSGALEWAIVAALFAVALASALLAYRERRLLHRPKVG